eukprot:791186-Rhodomonas_salina.1
MYRDGNDDDGHCGNWPERVGLQTVPHGPNARSGQHEVHGIKVHDAQDIEPGGEARVQADAVDAVERVEDLVEADHDLQLRLEAQIRRDGCDAAHEPSKRLELLHCHEEESHECGAADKESTESPELRSP